MFAKSNNLKRLFFFKISAQIGCFFGFSRHFHQHLIYVAYTCHTWMESCACQLNFDTKMSGLAYVPKEQGILLTVRKNPGPQPDTASYPCHEQKQFQPFFNKKFEAKL